MSELSAGEPAAEAFGPSPAPTQPQQAAASHPEVSNAETAPPPAENPTELAVRLPADARPQRGSSDPDVTRGSVDDESDESDAANGQPAARAAGSPAPARRRRRRRPSGSRSPSGQSGREQSP